MGQEKEVEVVKLVTANSIEEHILKMANQKKDLSECMLAEGQYAEEKRKEKEESSKKGKKGVNEDGEVIIESDDSDGGLGSDSFALFKHVLSDLVTAHKGD